MIINALHRTREPAPLSWGVCAGHGTVRTGCKSPCQVCAEPKARQRQGRSPRGGVRRQPRSKDAGRRTGTGEEVRYTWDEWARNHEVLHPQWGVLYKSGVHASKVLGLTPGDLRGVQSKVWMK
jgi:hypothetical protein